MSSSNNNVFGILALLAVLIFIALITLQVMEILYYRSPPSLWPAG